MTRSVDENMPDPRLNAYRPDLADSRLRGVVQADAYVDGQLARVTAPSAPVRARPDPEAPLTTEFLHGEPVTVFEDRPDDWVWAQSDVDGYVGYLPGSCLGPGILGAPDPTPVTALRAPVFRRPDIKSPVSMMLSMGALPITEPAGDSFVRVPALDGYLHIRHVADADRRDLAEIALMYLNAPYLWGGRSSLGLDCSALVQRALLEAGVPAPRDSDQQAATVGEAIPLDASGDAARWRRQRGDIVAFPGHIGIMIDEERLVHANATAMAVSVDPVDVVAERCRTDDAPGGVPGIVAVRRVSLSSPDSGPRD